LSSHCSQTTFDLFLSPCDGWLTVFSWHSSAPPEADRRPCLSESQPFLPAVQLTGGAFVEKRTPFRSLVVHAFVLTGLVWRGEVFPAYDPPPPGPVCGTNFPFCWSFAGQAVSAFIGFPPYLKFAILNWFFFFLSFTITPFFPTPGFLSIREV